MLRWVALAVVVVVGAARFFAVNTYVNNICDIKTLVVIVSIKSNSFYANHALNASKLIGALISSQINVITFHLFCQKIAVNEHLCEFTYVTYLYLCIMPLIDFHALQKR